MTDFQEINNLNLTPTALITGADKVPFYNTSDANPYAMTMDQLQTWVLAGGTIDPTFDDVSADTVTITGTTGNTLVVDTNTLVVDATNNAVLVGKTAASVGVDGAQFLTTGFSGVSAPNNTVFFLNRNGSDGTIVELARESTSRVTFGVTSQSLTIGTGGSERMRLDSSGNLGLGVTPSAWGGGFVAHQISRGSVAATTGEIDFSHNAFYDGAWKYIANGFATNHYTTNGTYVWRTAPSGTAGGAITFTQAMTLDASGNLGVGVTSPAHALHVQRDGADLYQGQFVNTSTATNARTAMRFQNDGGSVGYVGCHSTTAGSGIGFGNKMVMYGTTTNGIHLVASDVSGTIGFNTGGTASANERMRVKAEGQVRFVPLAADPATNVQAGDVYYNSGTNKLKVYNGTAWVDLH